MDFERFGGDIEECDCHLYENQGCNLCQAVDEAPAAPAIISPLIAMREQLATQDNACTAHPIFIVYNRKRLYGMDPDFGEDNNYAWINADGDFEESDERQKLIFDRYFNRYNRWPLGWEKRHFVEIDEFVTCTFTRAAAEEFVRRRSHNYRHLHVYVDSLHRNPEMIQVRQALMRGRLQEVA
ncbi:MAG TPA: hypothetical protein VGB69_01830 [Edaphobacter sp.]